MMLLSKIKTLKRSVDESRNLSYIEQKHGSTSPALLSRYAVRLNDTVKRSIKGDLSNDAVAKQYIPQNRELQVLPEERLDPIGDETHSPIKGIVHRYPDRVLLTPANACAVYCRYCFRREKVGKRGENLPAILSPQDLDAAMDYIASHSEIWEVILTGGDPLILAPRQMQTIIEKLNAINHVKVIRFHTRVPIADPARVSLALIKALTTKTNQSVSNDKALYMALHINHAQELGANTRAAIKSLHKAGITLLSQSVLLKGVNDNAETLATLYRELTALNVKPYYLHHPDLAPGTSHFRLSIEEGQKIVSQLQGRLSGLCQPTYMLDIPGGYGKIPLTPESLKAHTDGTHTLTDYKGAKHAYPPKGRPA